MGEGPGDGNRLRPIEGGCGSGVCRLSSMGVCRRGGLRPVPSPVTGFYGAGRDPWSLVSMPQWLQDTRAVRDLGQTLALATSPLQHCRLGASRRKPLVGRCWRV